MNERFTVVGIDKDTGKVKDKYGKCPLEDMHVGLMLAKGIADWLNENIKDYHRFEVREYPTNNGFPVYNLWDNEKDECIPFRPMLTHTTNPKAGLEDYVCWLNSLVEEDND
jgi:hypothetical protein